MSIQEAAPGTVLPEWLASFERPVVRSNSQSGGRVHAPNVQSEQPDRACHCGTASTDWVVEEYDPDDENQQLCQKLRCEMFMDLGGL